MSQTIDQYYVIGNPVKHSLSPKIHQQFALQTQQIIQYDALQIAEDTFEKSFKMLQLNPAVKGLSVTVPFKEKAFALADQHDQFATDAKAVSNIVFSQDRKAYGINLDGVGLVNDLIYNHNIMLKNKDILILGAGGAVRGCLASLIAEKPKSITIANRTLHKAENLAAQYKNDIQVNALEYSHLTKSYDLVINATSASIQQKMLPISPKSFKENSFGYDLMYAANGTVFTQWCQTHKINNADGKGMLLELSKAIFKIWRGIEPSTKNIQL
jgi:shikimate dehydrogenase